MNAKKLKPRLRPDTAIKVIGLGGVGSIVARYGAIFLAAQDVDCRLVLIDGDRFEPGNATRMFFGRCGNKAAVVKSEMRRRFKHSRMALTSVPQYVTPKNIGNLIHEGDIVLLCVDNHKTRKLVDDYCTTQLDNVCLISGGNDGVTRNTLGTYGNCQIYACRKDKSVTPTLSFYHPEIAEPKDKSPHEMNCTELVVSTPQILFANLAAASAILNTLWLYLCGHTHYAELNFDIEKALMRPTIPVT